MGERVDVWWSEQGQPARLVHGGARWRVIDRPTPLPEDVHPLITHPPERPTGWRCTARCEVDDTVVVFDLQTAADGWVVAKTYAG